MFSFSPSRAQAHDHAGGRMWPIAGRPRRQLHVGARAVRHGRSGARHQLDLAVVEPDAVGDDRARPEDPPLVEHLDGPTPQRSSDCSTSQVVSDEWVCRPVSNSSARAGAGEARLGAVQQVLEADPGPHPAPGAVGADRLEQRPVGVDRLEVVVAGLVGDVGHERGPDAQPLGDRRRPLHEPPHVHDRRRAGQQPLGVALQRGGPGDLGRQRPVGRVDVGAQPVPQRQRLGGPPQEPGVQVAVVQAGDDRVAGGVDDLGPSAAARGRRRRRRPGRRRRSCPRR